MSADLAGALAELVAAEVARQLPIVLAGPMALS